MFGAVINFPMNPMFVMPDKINVTFTKLLMSHRRMLYNLKKDVYNFWILIKRLNDKHSQSDIYQDSSIVFSFFKSFLFACFIIKLMNGTKSFENPEGSPLLRSVIRVR